jgi:hypothetical protein
MAENVSKSRYEITVDLIRALSWPFIFLLLLVLFWRPFHKIVNQFPNIVSRSESITIAGLSLKIQKSDIVQQPSDSVMTVLGKLSPEGIERILNNSSAIYWDKGHEEFGRRDNAELMQLGLMQEIPQDELYERNRQKNYGFGVRPTYLGVETRKFLIQLIAGFVKELKNT